MDDDDLTFEMPQHLFRVREDVSPYSEVGLVRTTTTAGASKGRRSMTIYDSNAEGFISVDAASGVIRTEARLDHERRPVIVLNLLLEDPDTGEESYCQVQ